jgi:hypothetical protein
MGSHRDELSLSRYGLNEQQLKLMDKFVADRGIDYVREKCAVVDQEPRPNQARVFGCVAGDWKPAVSSVKSSFRLIQAKHPEKLMQDLVTEAMDDLFAK